MIRKSTLLMFVLILSLVMAVPAFAGGPPPKKNAEVVVYVISQGLYYDSNINNADPLPPHGPFQQLFPPNTNTDCPPDTLCTEFGPGDPGHKGGRWWVDLDGDGEISEGDHLFSCPLLGPGRETP